MSVWRCPRIALGWLANAVMSTQISRNVSIHERRTSLRLERAIWDALEEICLREQTTLNALCTQIKDSGCERTLTASVRVHVLDYYRAATTEVGHRQAGHGTLPSEPLEGPSAKGSSRRATRLRDSGSSG